jgi:hypothetical protein
MWTNSSLIGFMHFMELKSLTIKLVENIIIINYYKGIGVFIQEDVFVYNLLLLILDIQTKMLFVQLFFEEL